MKVFWESTEGGDGIIMLEKDLLFADRDPENINGFRFTIRSGFMTGEFRVSKKDLRKLKYFLSRHVK